MLLAVFPALHQLRAARMSAGVFRSEGHRHISLKASCFSSKRQSRISSLRTEIRFRNPFAPWIVVDASGVGTAPCAPYLTGITAVNRRLSEVSFKLPQTLITTKCRLVVYIRKLGRSSANTAWNWKGSAKNAPSLFPCM